MHMRQLPHRPHQAVLIEKRCLDSSSSIGKHFRDEHLLTPKDLRKNFQVLKKCTNKFDCLVCEMFFINELRLKQSDSILAKVFK